MPVLHTCTCTFAVTLAILQLQYMSLKFFNCQNYYEKHASVIFHCYFMSVKVDNSIHIIFDRLWLIPWYMYGYLYLIV